MKRKERGRAVRHRGAIISIGEALRETGFGEGQLALDFCTLVGELRKRGDDLKLLLETLKECGRHLDAARERDGDGGDEAISVELVHSVARPEREKNRGQIGERERQIGFQFEKEKQ
jgi:hypothetical protein